VLSLTLVITAISGANFFSILMFWPTQAFNVYGHDPVGKTAPNNSILYASSLTLYRRRSENTSYRLRNPRWLLYHPRSPLTTPRTHP
jgi:hypothetical protein